METSQYITIALSRWKANKPKTKNIDYKQDQFLLKKQSGFFDALAN